MVCTLANYETKNDSESRIDGRVLRRFCIVMEKTGLRMSERSALPASPAARVHQRLDRYIYPFVREFSMFLARSLAQAPNFALTAFFAILHSVFT